MQAMLLGIKVSPWHFVPIYDTLINIMHQIYASLKVGLPSSQSLTTLHSAPLLWSSILETVLGVWTSTARKPSWQENEDIFPSSVHVSLVIVWEDENIINNAILESVWVAVATATQTSHWHIHGMQWN